MKYIHNNKKRMPIILKDAYEEKWLAGAGIPQFVYPYSVNLVGITL